MRLPPLLASLLLALTCGTVQADAPPRFPPQAVWHQDISNAATHADSATMISGLAGLGGFGYGRMQIDFSMHIVHAPANAPTRTIVGFPSNDEYYAPDCEPVGTPMPVPANAAIEGQTGLTCNNGNGDCHLLVVQGNTLYEAYTANASGATGLESMCLAVWKLDRVYQDSNRGEHCTSADAAGFPIAPLLFNADEVHAAMQVANGDLGHAIRFILPNPRMATNLVNGVRRKVYVRPASHAGGPSGPENTVPYGARLRLRSDFPVHLYPAGAQVVLRTMQRYGIVLADGGNIALTAESDLYTTRKWTEVGINSRVFDQAVPAAPVRVQDFAVIDTGPRIVETYDCVRNAEPPPPPASTPPSGIASRLLPATGGVRQTPDDLARRGRAGGRIAQRPVRAHDGQWRQLCRKLLRRRAPRHPYLQHRHQPVCVDRADETAAGTGRRAGQAGPGWQTPARARGTRRGAQRRQGTQPGLARVERQAEEVTGLPAARGDRVVAGQLVDVVNGPRRLVRRQFRENPGQAVADVLAVAGSGVVQDCRSAGHHVLALDFDRTAVEDVGQASLQVVELLGQDGAGLDGHGAVSGSVQQGMQETCQTQDCCVTGVLRGGSCGPTGKMPGSRGRSGVLHACRDRPGAATTYPQA